MDTVAKAIVDELVAAGVRHAFVLPGGAATYLVDALAAEPAITALPMLHEGSAGIAAESYYQYGGQLAVAAVTSGPGSTNVLTAVAAAFTDSAAMIVLAGQVKRADLDASPRGRQYGFQHLPMDEIARPITKAFVSLRDPAQAREQTRAAIATARSGRPGPVWVEVPLDVQNTPIPDSSAASGPSTGSEADASRAPGDAAAQFLNALQRAERPCILVGNGVRTAGALESARVLVRQLGVPVLVTWKMLDFLDEDDRLLAGRPGGLAPWSANLVQQQCDLLLVLGARLDHAQVGYRIDNLAPKATVFRVERDADEAGKWSEERLTTFVGDAGEFVDALAAVARAAGPSPEWLAWVDEVSDLRRRFGVPTVGLDESGELSMYEVSAVLGARLPADAIVVSGSSGQGIEILHQALPLRTTQRFYCSAALGSMGFGLAAAVGAHFAAQGRPVWCAEGDGSLSMSLHDLAAIGTRRLPIRLLLLDNGGYMSIRMSQERMVDTRLGFDESSHLPRPDFDRLAAACGWRVIGTSDADGLADAVAEAAETTDPVMIHVRLRHGEVAYPRVTTKATADGQLMTSGLDDMWPSLDEMYGQA